MLGVWARRYLKYSLPLCLFQSVLYRVQYKYYLSAFQKMEPRSASCCAIVLDKFSPLCRLARSVRSEETPISCVT